MVAREAHNLTDQVQFLAPQQNENHQIGGFFVLFWVDRIKSPGSCARRNFRLRERLNSSFG